MEDDYDYASIKEVSDNFPYSRESNLRIAGFEKESVVDGPGIRYTIFVQGCLKHCVGCHNPETHPLTGGEVLSIHDIFLDICSNPIIQGVTFSGGEPFLQYKALTNLAKMLKEKNYNVISYTGFLYEEIIKNQMLLPLLKQLDVLIDGPFLQDKKSLNCKFRGSTNQRIIDVKKSLNQMKLVLYE